MSRFCIASDVATAALKLAKTPIPCRGSRFTPIAKLMSSYSVPAIVSTLEPVYGGVSENIEGKFDYGLEKKIHIIDCRFALTVRLFQFYKRRGSAHDGKEDS